jgi:hypothetical protein
MSMNAKVFWETEGVGRDGTIGRIPMSLML